MLSLNNNFAVVGETAVGLFGAGGFGREVMPLIAKHPSIFQSRLPGGVKKFYFVEKDSAIDYINNYPVISDDEFIKMRCERRFFNIAIADSKLRENIAEKMISKGVQPISIYADSVSIYDDNEISDGVIMCANSVISSNVKIGKFFHANIHSYVAHDCVIGDYVTFAPGVICCGNVHIGRHAYIGAGAVIKQGSLSKPLVIGEGAIIGMGAVVTKDVPSFVTVVGNPARVV